MNRPEPLISLAAVTRQRFCAQLGLILPKVAQDLRDQLSQRLNTARAVSDMQAAREALTDFERSDRSWIDGIRASLQQRLHPRSNQSTRGLTTPGSLELVADEAIEDQLLASRLAGRIQDSAPQELSDLRLRLLFAEGRVELAPSDVVRPETISRIILDEWVRAGLTRETWRQISDRIGTSMASKVIDAYREANRFLVTNGVMPEITFSNAVRKVPSAPGGAGKPAGTLQDKPPNETAFAPTARFDPHGRQAGGTGNEWWSTARAQTQEVFGRIKRLFSDQASGFAPNGGGGQPHVPSPRLNAMLQEGKLQGFSQVLTPSGGADIDVSPAQMDDYIQLVRQRSADLKRAADSPSEKAIIEIVALMFQSILAEDRIKASLRIWFARLQIPVLRVALAEPDFFSTLQHPARRLIDRMGSCAMGFDANMSEVSVQALEVVIRRVVLIIEQYPETGRRVFQLVYDEFQAFLAKHLQSQGSAGKLVSIAQQVEQKETLTVQYTIELRKQLNDMPVRDDIRDFLFKIWAEVLAVASIKFDAKHETMAMLKSTAADLLWAASAKPTRGERTQVIAQLPQLLARLRKGMAMLGMDTAAQDQQIKRISDILADAFMSRTEIIPADQLAAVTRNLSSLEDFLPQDGVGDLDLDQDSIEMITGVDASNIVVVAQGGEPANQAMRAWALELQPGAWFRLDHNNSPCQVQFAWRSARNQLYMFATAQQRCYLIQTARVASYLQAGLLVPVEQESLTVRATRAALEKLDANPERLLN